MWGLKSMTENLSWRYVKNKYHYLCSNVLFPSVHLQITFDPSQVCTSTPVVFPLMQSLETLWFKVVIHGWTFRWRKSLISESHQYFCQWIQPQALFLVWVWSTPHLWIPALLIFYQVLGWLQCKNALWILVEHLLHFSCYDK